MSRPHHFETLLSPSTARDAGPNWRNAMTNKTAAVAAMNIQLLTNQAR
jgi:hypothetical protein